MSREDAVKDVNVVVLSIPFANNAELGGLFDDVPSDVVVIDTSNYYPFRDGMIPGAPAAADKARLPKRRDLAVEAFLERMGDPKANPNADFGVRVSRALFM